MSFTRREGLKLSIAAFLASLTKTAAAQSANSKTVVVIGAGIAGLGAAKYLQSQGAKVIVLEAGDRIGGRIWTDRSMGAPVEYGAAWIHGPNRRNPVKKLADQVGADTFWADDENLVIYDTEGEPLDESYYARLGEFYDDLIGELDDVAGSNDRRSVKQLIADMEPEALKNPVANWMISAYLEFDFASDAKNISAALTYADQAFSGDDVILPEGYDRILAPLAEGLDIRFNKRVSRISYSDTGVDVDGIQADYAVCAVPLGVLKANKIAFQPKLPKRVQSAIKNTGFGTVTKIALKFDEPFWDVDKQYFGILTEPKGRWNYWLNFRTFSDENILMGFSFGNYARRADGMSKREMTKDAMQVLRSVAGKSLPNPSKVLTTNWSKYPDFRGAYSYPQVGGRIAQFESFQRPISDRLFIAGEHTTFDYHSTTHGALMSGRRAAKEILDL